MRIDGQRNGRNWKRKKKYRVSKYKTDGIIYFDSYNIQNKIKNSFKSINYWLFFVDEIRIYQIFRPT